MKKLLTLYLLHIFTSQFCYAQTTSIRVWQHTEDKPGIIAITLNRALQITRDEYGDYELISSGKMGQDRALRELAHNQLDIAHFVATKEREAQANAIYVPITQGLLGYRLCLIKAENQERFSGINNKQQWIDKKITIGQHRNWPDTTILNSNDLEVLTTFKSELLFQQLAKNRFDCFARGVSEITHEQVAHKALNLEIEKSIVIYYPLAQFFFVNPANPMLAKRLQKGLSLLQKNGELNQIFDRYYRDKINHLNLKNRVFIPLKNPTLSQKTVDALAAPSTRFQRIYLSDDKKKLR